MIMFKKKITRFAMGVVVTSAITLGFITPVSAMEIQHNFEDNAGTKIQGEVMDDSFTSRHAAAQFTSNEDGERVLTVTPKANFRSHNRNFKNEAYEIPIVDEETPVVVTPIVDEETPVVDEETPVVVTPIVDEETPVVDEETPVVVTPIVDEETPVVDEETPVIVTPIVDEETPVVDEETPVVEEVSTDESTQNQFYAHLFEAYDKLLTLYEKLLDSFSPVRTV